MRKINTRLFLIKYLLSTQAGFSLLEALMAVVVVSILMTAILPMIVLSTATRVQSRRVDLATQAARSYIDGVRSGVIDITTAGSSFPFINTDTARNQYFQNTLAPSSTNIASLNGIQGIKVDTNGNGFNVTDPQDLVIQPMRTGGSDLATQGFYMQVRVYRADAFTTDGSKDVNGVLNITGIQSGLALQTGNNETACPNGRRVVTSTGGGKDCPLVVMKVDINQPTSTMSQIKSRL
jgi:prepilin-type N-terminal cleavage/methylation domain-containing protein